jgi:release factor glutamine methyltransferase
MTNSKELFNDLVSRVLLKEDKSEIQSIIYLLLEKKLGLTKIEILTGKEIDPIQPGFFEQLIEQLNAHAPIQYILGEAEFYGRTFQVNPFVLIPRPETELLVREIKRALFKLNFAFPRILDVGTGSGCIAITLALEIPQSSVQATDICKEAINTAMQNAKSLGASIKYHEHNILTHDIPFGQFDLIVSNPPYISGEEKSSMSKNVLEHEPHLALFAPEKDPLAFYKSIAFKSKTSLSSGGTVWVEINEHFGNEVVNIFKQQEYHNIQIINDLDNKHRIVTARYE